MNKNVRSKPFKILIADDDKDDVQMAKDSFKDHDLVVEVNAVDDGQYLIDLLREQDKNLLRRNLPQLILLDLNMPRKNGFEALKEIKEDVELRKIPVVIFSTSSSQKDIEKAYELGANCFVTKPQNTDDWSKTLGQLGKFWSQCVSFSE